MLKSNFSVGVPVFSFTRSRVDMHGFLLFLAIKIGFFSGIAVLAPLARYSLSTATKSTQKRPPTSFALRVPEFSGIAYEPALMRRPGAQG